MRFPFESKVLIKISDLKSQSINSKKPFSLFSKYKMSEDNNYAGYETAPQDRDTNVDRKPSVDRHGVDKIGGHLIRFPEELDK